MPETACPPKKAVGKVMMDAPKAIPTSVPHVSHVNLIQNSELKEKFTK